MYYCKAEKDDIMEKVARYFIDSGLYEVEIMYFNRKPPKNINKGKGVFISKWNDGRMIGQFQICNYEYICDTKKEKEKAAFNFLVMSCAYSVNTARLYPCMLMNNSNGELVDRKGLNTYEELIKEGNKILSDISNPQLNPHVNEREKRKGLLVNKHQQAFSYMIVLKMSDALGITLLLNSIIGILNIPLTFMHGIFLY